MKDCIKFICRKFSSRKRKSSSKKVWSISIEKFSFQTTSKSSNLSITILWVSSISSTNGALLPPLMSRLSSPNSDTTIKSNNISLLPILTYLPLSLESSTLPNRLITQCSDSEKRTKICSEIKLKMSWKAPNIQFFAAFSPMRKKKPIEMKDSHSQKTLRKNKPKLLKNSSQSNTANKWVTSWTIWGKASYISYDASNPTIKRKPCCWKMKFSSIKFATLEFWTRLK